MVKVRGYSVVLGSVEAAIAKLVGVSQCCVVASGEEGTDKRLVAYLVGCTPEANRGRLPIESAEIDAYGRSPVLFQELIKDLPHYAVPSVYMVLDSMPIHKTSAKTDRHALPPPPPSPPAAVIPDGFVFENSDASIQLVFEEVLGLPKDTLTADSNFFEFGGHSLLVTQLLARIKALGGPEVTVADFLQSPTVSGFARAMRGESAPSEPARLLPREVEKYTSGMSDININVQAFWRYIVFTNSSARVLLTGATGYVGVNLLAHLLQTTAAQVFCIVRARSDNEDVHARVVANLEAHGFEGLDVSRIQVIAGDVSQHNMGLSDDDYLFLQQLVDVVIHTAANVNLAYSYSLLEAANVHGTAHMIDFARGGKVKALHFISTDGIFPEMGDIGSFSEEDVPPHHLLQTGYGQTKWVAEQLVAGARRLGMPCVVYRLGNVAGPLAGSGWNGSDSNLLFLRACLDRRSVPRDDHWGIEFTPVDFVAKFITSCIMDLEFANGKTFHLINSSKLPMQLVGEAAKRAGFPTNRVDKSSWCEEGKNAEGLLSVVLGEDALESLMGRHHEYLKDNVNKACKHFGMTYPVIDSAALDGYFARLIGEGLLPSPPTSEKLGGRVALVTGATSSIGQGIAVALAAEGATVVLAARGAEKLHQVSAKLNGAVSMPCDLSSREAVENMISQVEQKHKIIDILVNCAEAVPQQTHVENTEAVLDANCTGVVHMCGATVPMMSQAGSGHIVNISLDSSLKSGCTDLSVHDASKAFVKAFSKGLRSQFAGTGVRITDVQPADAAALKPDDVAAAVLYAVSSPAHVGVHEVFVEARVNSMTQPL
jgi:thioester reductase-like protein